jgi:catechol 2,3-dioxygenase-like lactoylglutathione lyase family enzyme
MSLPVDNLEDALPFYENIMGFRVVSREGAGSREFSHIRDFRPYQVPPQSLRLSQSYKLKVFSQVAASMHFLNWVIPSKA